MLQTRASCFIFFSQPLVAALFTLALGSVVSWKLIPALTFEDFLALVY